MTSIFVVNFITILTKLAFNPSKLIRLAWTYPSSSVSNPHVSLGLKHVLLIYRQSLSSPQLLTVHFDFIWYSKQKFGKEAENITILDTQDYFCSFRDGQQCVLGEVCKILQLVLVMPATNCTCESLLTSTMYCMCTKKDLVHWTSPILGISLLLGVSYILGLLGSSCDKSD